MSFKAAAAEPGDFHVVKTELRNMLAASKYEEDNLKNGHATVWGSFYCVLTNESKLCLGQDLVVFLDAYSMAF